MCGITGFLTRGTAHSAHDLEAIAHKMTHALRHRGPNSQNIWASPHHNVALGHTRLSVHDLHQHANQPMVSQNENFVLVFNGEIYNFKALRQALEKENIAFHTESDTEVLLALCEHKGFFETLNLIQGMFAFALWNKNEKTLCLARDRVGKKPLYYSVTGESFLFASELKALYPHPDFKKHLNQKAIQAYFEYGCVPGNMSIFEKTHKLMPGHALTVNHNLEVQIQAYSKPSIAPAPQGDLMAETKQRLRQAVKTRLASDVPLGAFLSGGIDSSLVTALMQEESTKPIHSFAIGFENSEFDESVYAEKVAKHLGTQHETFIVTEQDAQGIIPSLQTMFDEPFADSSAIPTFLLAKMARSKVTVALTGDGGDETFGGYNRYRYAKMLSRLAYLPKPLRSVMAMPFSSPTIQGLLKKHLFKNTPQFQQKAQKLSDALAFENEKHSYDKIVKVFNLSHEGENITLPHQVNNVAKWQYRDLIGYLTDDVLTKVDRATMAVGLEARSPFLDQEVVQWGLSLPIEYKIKGSETKWVLRQLLQEYVPQHLFTRPKQGFALPMSVWLRTSLKAWAEHLLFEVQDPHCPISQKEIALLWQAHQNNQQDASQKLWTLLMWRNFLETMI